MKKQLTLLALTLACLHSSQAGDLSNLATLNAAEFRAVSEDLGSALSYKALLPTEGQGITGFDLGVAVTSSDMSHSSGALNKAGADLTSSALQTVRLHAHKGLPLGFDIGGFVASVPGLDATLSGAELRYALLGGNIALPAVGVRGAYTRLSGSEQLSLSTRSLDISVSKGFAMLTPYAGVGRVWVDSEARVGGLGNVNPSLGKVYAGANLGLGLMNLAFEVDKTGEATTWGLKLGLRW